MADTLPRLAGSPKKRIPDAATGSLGQPGQRRDPNPPNKRPEDERKRYVQTHLFRAPTIEYVVDPHVLTHHAVEYEMKTATAPEKAIAERRKVLFSAGLARVSYVDPQDDG